MHGWVCLTINEYTEVMIAWRVVNNTYFMKNPAGAGAC